MKEHSFCNVARQRIHLSTAETWKSLGERLCIVLCRLFCPEPFRVIPHHNFAHLHMCYCQRRFFIDKAIAKRMMLQQESTMTQLHYVHFALSCFCLQEKKRIRRLKKNRLRTSHIVYICHVPDPFFKFICKDSALFANNTMSPANSRTSHSLSSISLLP